MKTGGKNSALLTFLLISIIYVLTRWLIFNGFNGTDDMQYAMLSARMMRHQFTPFLSDDIWSGRVLLIGFQALIYRVGGINVLTTQLGTLLATIAACWLTIFRLLKNQQPYSVMLTCSLFYFNPVLTSASRGIMPDPYIMLIGIWLALFLKNIIHNETPSNRLFKSFVIGVLQGLSLFVKEIALLFLPFCCLIFLIYRKKSAYPWIGFLLIGFTSIIVATGLYYFIYTGDAFFKLSQINNSNFPNSCSDIIELKALLIRLTYGVWQSFFNQGFFPIPIALAILIVQLSENGKIFLKTNFNSIIFLVLLLLGMYFPFSLVQYKPVCAESRHFLFLLPWAVVGISEYLYPFLLNIQKQNKAIWIFLFLFALCTISTSNKWQWMIYFLLFSFFFMWFWLNQYNFQAVLLLCALLWLGMMENYFINYRPWFKEMKTLNRNLSTRRYYFVDHDDMANWQLLHHFNSPEILYFNLENKPFFIFRHYYTPVDSFTFQPGWLILHKTYTSRSEKFLSDIEALKKGNGFGQIIQQPNMDALLINNSKMLDTLKKLIASD